MTLDSRDLIFDVDPSIPLAHVSVAWKVGSLLDPVGLEGATRLLLRLMRRGIPGCGYEHLEEKLELLGGAISIDVSRSVAGFSGTCLTRNYSEFLELVRQIVLEPSLDKDEFEKLKEEAIGEWVESLNEDSVIARRSFSRNLFPGHAYSRPAGGTRSSLERITLSDLKGIAAKLFSKNGVSFAFAGAATPEESQRFARSLAEALPDLPAQEIDPPSPTVPTGRRLLFVDKPERSQTQILIGGLGTHPADEDHTALFLAHTIFGGTFSARLSREVRGKRGWSYGAYTNLPFDRQRQAFSMWTFPQAEDAGPCIELQLRLLEELLKDGVTQSELRAAKKYLTNSYAFSVDTSLKRASLALDERLYCLPEGYFQRQNARISDITVEEVQRALNNRLSSQNLLVTVVGTAGSTLSSVRAAVANWSSEEVLAFDSPD